MRWRRASHSAQTGAEHDGGCDGDSGVGRNRVGTGGERVGGGVVISVHGKELVEMSQPPISSQVWHDDGGPCTIVYYRPLMCLVVRATGDTHGNVEGLLDGLRRAGP